MVKDKQAVTDNGNGIGELFTDGVVVDIAVHWWRGQRKLSAADLNIKESDVPEIFSLGRKMLIPRDTVRRFHALEARAADTLAAYSWQLPIGGRFVPFGALEGLLDKLNAIKATFDTYTEEFLGEYASVQKDMLRQYKPYAKALRGFYPPLGEISRRFNFVMSLYEIRMPRDIKAAAVTEEKVRGKARRAQAKAAVEKTALEKYRETLHKRMNDWLEEVATTMRQETVRVCTQIAAAVADGKLHHKQVQSLQTWIERFESLNFMHDTAMGKVLSDLKAQVGDSANDINSSPDALAAVGLACQTALKEAQKAAAPQAIASRYRTRKVRA